MVGSYESTNWPSTNCMLSEDFPTERYPIIATFRCLYVIFEFVQWSIVSNLFCVDFSSNTHTLYPKIDWVWSWQGPPQLTFSLYSLLISCPSIRVAERTLSQNIQRNYLQQEGIHTDDNQIQNERNPQTQQAPPQSLGQRVLRPRVLGRSAKLRAPYQVTEELFHRFTDMVKDYTDKTMGYTG